LIRYKKKKRSWFPAGYPTSLNNKEQTTKNGETIATNNGHLPLHKQQAAKHQTPNNKNNRKTIKNCKNIKNTKKHKHT